MRHSPEFRDARVVIVGAPGSGRFELLHAVTARCGGEAPEAVDGGPWKVIRSEVPSHGLRLDLCCLDGACDYRGVQRLLAERADGVIFMIDVSPDRLMEGRRVFDGLRPGIERRGSPFVVQYHRVEKEPRFEAGRLDAWLDFQGIGRLRVATASEAPDGPGGAFDRLVERLVETRGG